MDKFVIKSKRSDFDPDRDEIKKAVSEYIQEGKTIKKIETSPREDDKNLFFSSEKQRRKPFYRKFGPIR